MKRDIAQLYLLWQFIILKVWMLMRMIQLKQTRIQEEDWIIEEIELKYIQNDRILVNHPWTNGTTTSKVKRRLIHLRIQTCWVNQAWWAWPVGSHQIVILITHYGHSWINSMWTSIHLRKLYKIKGYTTWSYNIKELKSHPCLRSIYHSSWGKDNK